MLRVTEDYLSSSTFTIFVMLGCMEKYPRRTDCNAHVKPLPYEYDVALH